MDMFHVGDRVKCVRGFLGVHKEELGTIQNIRGDGSGICDISVRWDEYSTHRHDNDGLCENGHGWMVSARDLELVYCVNDLGELSVSPDDILNLFI